MKGFREISLVLIFSSCAIWRRYEIGLRGCLYPRIVSKSTELEHLDFTSSIVLSKPNRTLGKYFEHETSISRKDTIQTWVEEIQVDVAF